MALTEETMKQLLAQFNKDFDLKLEKVEENITTRINNNIDEKFSSYQEELKALREVTEKQEIRLDIVERQIRQRNLILFGIKEEEQNYFELEKIVVDIINVQLDVPCNKTEIEFVRRMGKKSNNPRPICFGLTTLGKKINILKEKSKLEKTGAYIKEDYPPKILKLRKDLQEKLMEEREKGNKASIRYDRIVILKNSAQDKKREENNNKRPLEISPPRPSTSTAMSQNTASSTGTSINQPAKKNKIFGGSPINPKISLFLNSTSKK